MTIGKADRTSVGDLSRRNFLHLAGLAGGAGTLATAGALARPAAAAAQPMLADVAAATTGQPFIQLSTYGAKGNARFVTDGAMTSGSKLLTCATSKPFSSTDVGKHIVVTAAGGSGVKLWTIIDTVTSASQVTLHAAAVATVSGSGVCFGTDDGPALTAALGAARTALGGKILWDVPHSMLATPTAVDMSVNGTAAGQVIISGLGSGAAVTPATARGATAIQIINVEDLLFEQLTFVGTPLEPNDADISFFLGTCGNTTFRDVSLVGVTSEGTSGSVIQADHCELTLDRCHFAGCSANGTRPIVENTGFTAFRATGCSWWDFGYYGQLYFTDYQPPGSWVHFGTTSGYAGRDGVISFEGCVMDETPMTRVVIDPGTPHVPRATFDNCRFQVVVYTGALGLKAVNVDSLVIRDTWFGWTQAPNPHDAIWASGCGNIVLERVVCGDYANRITVASSTSLQLTDCTYATLSVTGTPTTIHSKGAGGLVANTKAGVTSDADFAVAPPDGTVVVDTSAKKIGVRMGGRWVWTAALA